MKEGYLKTTTCSFFKKKEEKDNNKQQEQELDATVDEEDIKCDEKFMETLSHLKKGMILTNPSYWIKEGETSPPKRYSSGTLILAMENAGQLLEDEDLRAQIKGAGIGTSATRAEILKTLVTNDYLRRNKKTHVITPTCLGQIIYEVVSGSIRSMLNQKLTAIGDKGLKN